MFQFYNGRNGCIMAVRSIKMLEVDGEGRQNIEQIDQRSHDSSLSIVRLVTMKPITFMTVNKQFNE